MAVPMKEKKSVNPTKKLGKRMRALRELIDSTNLYSVTDAVSVIKKAATAKFDETVDIAINLNVDPKHADQMVRGVVAMPNGTGKNVRVAVFAKADKLDEAVKAGADIVGAEDLVEKIKAGEINFDRCIATPDMMAVLGSVAKILGPRGLMPNPKLGTVTVNVADAVKAAKSGQVEFRVDKAGIIHAAIGKASFSADALLENMKAFVGAIIKAKPTGVKGTYLKSISLSSTMSPSIKVELATVL